MEIVCQYHLNLKMKQFVAYIFVALLRGGNILPTKVLHDKITLVTFLLPQISDKIGTNIISAKFPHYTDLRTPLYTFICMLHHTHLCKRTLLKSRLFLSILSSGSTPSQLMGSTMGSGLCRMQHTTASLKCCDF